MMVASYTHLKKRTPFLCQNNRSPLCAPNTGHNIQTTVYLKNYHLYGQLWRQVCPLLRQAKVSALHEMGSQEKHGPLTISSRCLPLWSLHFHPIERSLYSHQWPARLLLGPLHCSSRKIVIQSIISSCPVWTTLPQWRYHHTKLQEG